MASNLLPTTGVQAALAVLVSGSPVIVPGINWSLTLDPHNKDVSNFRDGRIAFATLLSGEVTMTLVYDDNAPNTLVAGANLRPGATGTARLYIDATPNYYVFPFIVGPYKADNAGMEDLLMDSITLTFNNGTLVYPTNG